MSREKPLFKGRDNDVVGLAVGYAKIGSHAQGLASDTADFTAPGYPERSAETVIETTCQYQVTPWWQLQDDFQYVFPPRRRHSGSERPVRARA